jgi:hypothetical protein
MKKILEEKQEVYEYLQEISHTLQSQYTFPVPHFDHITSNINELINAP